MKQVTEINQIRHDFKRGRFEDFKKWFNQTDWTVLDNLEVEESWNLIHS